MRLKFYLLSIYVFVFFLIPIDIVKADSLNGADMNGPSTNSPGSLMDTSPPIGPVNPQSNTNSTGNNSGQPGNLSNQPPPENNSSPSNNNAPTFMNGVLPNTPNPLLPNSVSPGSFSYPLTNFYEQAGFPTLAAPLMSAVFQPFGLSLIQPNPFQVVPQGMFSLTGTLEGDTNINYSPNQPQEGWLYSVSPAIAYSTFDDYGYLSVMGNIGLYEYPDNKAQIPSYLTELGSIAAGTYLGTRVFVGVQDFGERESFIYPSGSTLGFLNGINPYLMNTGEAEVGVAATPHLTFVQSAIDTYFDGSAFGIGLMNIQTLTETVNYKDYRNIVSTSYSYSMGQITAFPTFTTNTISESASHFLSPSSILGLGGSFNDFSYQNDSSLNFGMWSAYASFTRTISKSLSFSLEAGWNATQFQTGQSFSSPMLDFNFGYTSPKISLGVNAGEFQVNEQAIGVSFGPAKVEQAIGYISYNFSPKTYLSASVGYQIFDFMEASSFSAPYVNPAFQNLQSNTSYNGAFLSSGGGLYWKVRPWLLSGIMFNRYEFLTNVPNSSVTDNQLIALISIQLPF